MDPEQSQVLSLSLGFVRQCLKHCGGNPAMLSANPSNAISLLLVGHSLVTGKRMYPNLLYLLLLAIMVSIY